MSLPITTTTVRVERPKEADLTGDPYDPPSGPRDVVVTGLGATLSGPSGSESSEGGDKVILTWALHTDPADIRRYDVVVDESTDEEYDVSWAVSRVHPGGSLDHVRGQVTQVKGIT